MRSTMLLLCFAAFASAAEYRHTIIEYSDAACTKELKMYTKTTLDDAIGVQMNNAGVCDGTVGYRCEASNILGLRYGGSSCTEGGVTQYLLINQCNTVPATSTSWKLTDLKGCLDKDGTTYYAQLGIYAPGCADSTLAQTTSIGTSKKTEGEALNGAGVNIDGKCLKCSGAGLDMTVYEDNKGCTGAVSFTTGEVKIDECHEMTVGDDDTKRTIGVKLLSSFGCPSNDDSISIAMVGGIAGGAVGVCLILALLGGLFYLKSKKNFKKAAAADDNAGNPIKV